MAHSCITAHGYPVEIVVGQSDVDSKYKCSSCRLLLRDPIQSFCGHRFCKLCIESLIGSGSEPICPLCTEENVEGEFSILRLDQTFPDNAIKREFQNLDVKCVFSHETEQCSWTGKFKQYEMHVRECELRPEVCVCGVQVTYKYLVQHQAMQCAQRVVKCDHCQQDVVFATLQDHRGQCPRFPINCPQCNKQIVQEELAAHQNPETGDCENMAVLCPFGCGLPVQKNALMPHLQDNIAEHMAKLTERSSGIENHVREAIEKLRELSAGQVQSNEQQTSGATAAQQDSRYRELELRISTFENVTSVLHREVERQITALEEANRQREADKNAIDGLNSKVKHLERMLAQKDIALAEQDLRVSSLEQASTDGILLWKISDFSRKRQEAISGKTTSLYSPPFFTSKQGYRMCARVYLNGDGMGKGSHVSLFFVMMRNNYDALLRWPFRQKVTLMLLDQNHRDHIVEAFRPDPSSSSFKRPTSDMNIASGCPLFMPLTQLESSSHAYVKEDTIFIKVVVDCSDLK